MLVTRLSKVAMTLALSAFAFMVTFNNIIDFGSNYAFVQHVLSMDTTFPSNTLMYRAITAQVLWYAGYWFIIASEGLTFVLLLIGALSLWRARNGSAKAFNRAKKWVYLGATLGFLVWFLGFIVVGGEWFLMWQSQTWNGIESAFRFYITIIGVLIYVNQPDVELIED
ncbi:DUF2165 family protein [Andreprevotia chitinilytica]|uniref:DUF2165 family protein n=1 Tax=Andreprevotia chitinilytica TaxID=396808 RepID=UPI000B1CE347|nr:DUF2165 domain-containing protein [Andreprevotia chitinilytica]